MRATSRIALAVVLFTMSSCGGENKRTTFNPVSNAPASALDASARPGEPGSSRITVSGEFTLVWTSDFQCSYTVDDFFVRGSLGDVDGVPAFVSINVEFYRRPGPYVRRVQVLVRRISSDGTFYASWYAARATATVLPHGQGTDLESITALPEAGTRSTRPIRIGGHFGCQGSPSPGPG